MDLEGRIKFNRQLKIPFKKVNFKEEGHKYWITGYEGVPIKSVSSLLKYFYEEFKTEEEAKKWAKKRNLPLDYVLSAWEGEGEIANKHGSAVHLIGENYGKWKFLGEGERPVPIDKKSLGAIQFLEDLPNHLVPVAFELQMYSPNYWYTGTADIILLNTQNNKLIIADYKTNKDLFSEDFTQPPLYRIPSEYGLVQDNFGKYSLQFNFYQILLEDMGFQVQARILVWLVDDKPNKKLYKTYKTKNVTTDLRNFLERGLHRD